ncbi:MAG: hypothetical protein WBF88_12510 [Pusillimonas sp.]
MVDKSRPKNQRGEAPGRAQTTDARNNQKNKKPSPAATDDKPRREDEQVGDLLRSPSPENGGSRDEKGVVPGRQKPD